MDVTFLGAVNAIGGNKFLLTDGKDTGSRVLLDFGMQFGDPESFAKSDRALGSTGAFFDEFLPPRTNAGLRDLLRLRILPSVDGIYRDDWLLVPEFERAVTDAVGDVPYRDFWASDLDSYQAYKAKNGRPFVDGILLTHAHADHFQHLAYVDPEIPVYCTDVTRSIIKTAGEVAQQRDTTESYTAKLRTLVRAGKTSKFPGTWKYGTGKETTEKPRDYRIVTPWEPFAVGAFKVTAIPIDHSVPGACFFLIEGSDGKRVLYTGDFRFHGVYEAASTEARTKLQGLKPDALLCEGTRIDSEHVVYEHDVLQTTRDTMKRTTGLVLAEWGWKDATRFLTMQQAAEAAGRTLLVDPRVAYMLHDLAKVDPTFHPIEHYGNVRVYIRRKDSMLYSPGDYKTHELGYVHDWDDPTKKQAQAYLAGEDGAEAPPSLAHYVNGVRADQVRKHPERFVVQSSFFQMNELFDLDPRPGSYYIKSSCEPFNDEMVSDERKQTNWLNQWGIASNFIENAGGHHTSGHASGSELAAFWKIVQPKTLFPIHTQNPARYQEWWESGNIQAPRYGETVTI